MYGLGGDATNGQAVAAIFAAKDRPRFNPLICHVLDAAQAGILAEIDERTRALAERFWPGPLTLVLPRRASSPVSLLASAGLDSIAVRAPDHDDRPGADRGGGGSHCRAERQPLWQP